MAATTGATSGASGGQTVADADATQKQSQEFQLALMKIQEKGAMFQAFINFMIKSSQNNEQASDKMTR